jgi:hypothetical protein
MPSPAAIRSPAGIGVPCQRGRRLGSAHREQYPRQAKDAPELPGPKESAGGLGRLGQFRIQWGGTLRIHKDIFENYFSVLG